MEDGAVGGFEDESGIADHFEVGGGGLAGGGEVVADEDGVGGVEAQGLQRSQLHFTAASDANFLAGQEQAEEAEHPQTLAGRQIAAIDEGCAGDWNQEIHGNAGHVELPQRQGQVNYVVSRLAHAENATGAGGQSGSFDGFDSADAILKGVGGANIFVVGLSGIEVMVDAIDPSRSKALGLIFIQQTQAGTDFHRVLGFDFAHQIQYTVEGGFGGRSPRNYHAKRSGFEGMGALGSGEYPVFRHQGILVDFGGGDF